MTIVLYRYSDTLEGKLPPTQASIIEQKASTPTLFDVPTITRQIDSPNVEKGVASIRTETEKTLNSIFLDKKEETKLQKAKRILGEDITEVTDDELRVYVAEFEFLLDSWLDKYEKGVFEGKTLKQLIKEDNNGTFSNG